MTGSLFDKVHVCEGCGKRQERFLPLDWQQCGTSTIHPGQLASWCGTCVGLGKMAREAKGPTE